MINYLKRYVDISSLKIARWSRDDPNIPLSECKWTCMQVFKLVKKAAKRKQVKRGVKEVIKAIRKKTKGYV